VEGENRGPDDAQMSEVVPERWETAVEDVAQVVALTLDRAQDLADAVNDLVRTRPVLTKAILAGVVGAIVGGFIAERTRPRRPTLADRSRLAAEGVTRAAQDAASRAATRAQTIAEQAASAAQSAAERVAERLPSREELRSRIPSRSEFQQRMPPRNGRSSRGPATPDPGQMRSAAQLVPLALALLRNPLVRDFLMRSAVRAARRRPG